MATYLEDEDKSDLPPEVAAMKCRETAEHLQTMTDWEATNTMFGVVIGLLQSLPFDPDQQTMVLVNADKGEYSRVKVSGFLEDMARRLRRDDGSTRDTFKLDRNTQTVGRA